MSNRINAYLKMLMRAVTPVRKLFLCISKN